MQLVTRTSTKGKALVLHASVLGVLIPVQAVFDPVLIGTPLWGQPLDRSSAFALAVPFGAWLLLGLGPVALLIWTMQMPVEVKWRSVTRSWSWLALTALVPSVLWVLLLADQNNGDARGTPLVPILAALGSIYLIVDLITVVLRRRSGHRHE